MVSPSCRPQSCVPVATSLRDPIGGADVARQPTLSRFEISLQRQDLRPPTMIMNLGRPPALALHGEKVDVLAVDLNLADSRRSPAETLHCYVPDANASTTLFQLQSCTAVKYAEANATTKGACHLKFGTEYAE